MQTITTEEGKKIQIDEMLYNMLLEEYQRGTWSSIISVRHQQHVIILQDNFSQKEKAVVSPTAY